MAYRLGGIGRLRNIARREKSRSLVDEGSAEAYHSGRDRSGHRWRSPWLSIPFITIFAVLMLVLAAVTPYLWELSRHEAGFTLPHLGHYTWTYGPTVVLTILMSLWNPVVYSCKLRQPWQQLHSGPTDAERSVLLDYVSPIEVVSLYRAIRFCHVPVISAILVGLLLRVATVVSTGLLVPLPTRTPFHDFGVQLLSNFNSSAPLGRNDHLAKLVLQASSNIDALVKYKLPFPFGTQPDFAFQRFSLPNITLVNSGDPKFRVVVDAFRPNINCEPVDVSLSAFPDPEYEGQHVISGTAQWPSCPQNNPLSNFTDFSAEYENKPNVSLSSLTQLTNCTDSAQDSWISMVLLESQYFKPSIPGAVIQVEPKDGVSSNVWRYQISRVAGVACSFNYSIESTQVTYDLGGVIPDLEYIETIESTRGRHLPNLDASKFTDAMLFFRDAMNPTILNNVDDRIPQIDVNIVDSIGTIFFWIQYLGNVTLDALLDKPAPLTALMKTVFEYVGVQTANIIFSTETSTPFPGQLSTVAIRLHVSPVIACSMAVLFLIGAVFTIVLILFRPRLELPWSVGSIGGVALIMLRSPGLRRYLSSPSSIPFKDYKKAWGSHYFLLRPIGKEQQLSIQAESTPTEEAPTSGKSDREHFVTEWYRPVILQPTTFSFLTCFALIVIIMLEVLQQLSYRDGGLGSVRRLKSALTIAATRFVPSLVVVALAMLYGSFDFNVALFTPYANLGKGHARFTTSVNGSFLGQLLPIAIVKAIRVRDWAVALAMVSALLASLLTIIVSGLYQFENVPKSIAVPMLQVDSWYPNGASGGRRGFDQDVGGAATLLGDFTLFNLSYPAWTNTDVAVPTLDLAPEIMYEIGNSTHPNITVTIPVFRAELDCTNKTMINLPVNKTTQFKFGSGTGQLYTIDQSDPCPTVLPVGLTLSAEVAVNPDVSRDWTAEFSFNRSGGGQFCPLMTADFGHWFLGNESTRSSFNDTNLDCYQYVTEVQMNVTLGVPNMTVLSAVQIDSPVEYLDIEGSKINLAVTPMAMANVPYDATSIFRSFQSPGNFSCWDGTSGPVDSFFELLLCPVRGERLLDPQDVYSVDNDTSRVRVTQALAAGYRRYMAQVANKKMRRQLTGGARLPVTGWWYNPERYIVRQDRTSKTILQALLAVIASCSTAAFFLIDTRRVLPHNPCSIAGTGSLLAGSDMCRPRSHKGEDDVDVDDPDVGAWAARQQARWSKQQFSIGWWSGGSTVDEDATEWRYGIDVVDGSRGKTVSRSPPVRETQDGARSSRSS